MSDLGPRERLIALLVVYDATSLDKVDLLLHEFEGREKALFEVFARRFGLTLAQAWDTGKSPLGFSLNIIF